MHRNILLIKISVFMMFLATVPFLSGFTFFLLYDRETGSLWYPNKDGLLGIQGVYFERKLPKLSSDDTHWREWQIRHPDSKIMD
jgi:hypothetical protein